MSPPVMTMREVLSDTTLCDICGNKTRVPGSVYCMPCAQYVPRIEKRLRTFGDAIQVNFYWIQGQNQLYGTLNNKGFCFAATLIWILCSLRSADWPYTMGQFVNLFKARQLLMPQSADYRIISNLSEELQEVHDLYYSEYYIQRNRATVTSRFPARSVPKMPVLSDEITEEIMSNIMYWEEGHGLRRVLPKAFNRQDLTAQLRAGSISQHQYINTLWSPRKDATIEDFCKSLLGFAQSTAPEILRQTRFLLDITGPTLSHAIGFYVRNDHTGTQITMFDPNIGELNFPIFSTDPTILSRFFYKFYKLEIYTLNIVRYEPIPSFAQR